MCDNLPMFTIQTFLRTFSIRIRFKAIIAIIIGMYGCRSGKVLFIIPHLPSLLLIAFSLLSGSFPLFSESFLLAMASAYPRK